MSQSLLGSTENIRININNNNNNKWSPKTLNGCLTRTLEDPAAAANHSSPTTTEMPASSSSPTTTEMPASSSPSSSLASSLASSSDVNTVTSFSSSPPSKSDAAARKSSMTNGILPPPSLLMMAISSSSSSTQTLEAILITSSALTSSSSSSSAPSSTKPKHNDKSKSPTSDHPMLSSLSSPEVSPSAPPVSRSSPQSSRPEDATRELQSSASLSSCLTAYLSVKSSRSFSPYVTAPPSRTPGLTACRPKSLAEDSPIPRVSEISEKHEEPKHSNWKAPRDLDLSEELSLRQPTEAPHEPKTQTATADGGCITCSREENERMQIVDGSTTFSAGHDSSLTVDPGQTYFESPEGRSDGADRSQNFSRDPLFALSKGRVAHAPISNIGSLSPQTAAQRLVLPAVSSSIKPTHSSTFGGFLSKLKDVLPRRDSTSDLSKSSRLEKSTTALILQERQAGLPSKAADEEARHRMMYDNIIEEVKKKEKSTACKNMERVRNQLKMEDLMSSALKVWKRDLLPYWDDVRNNYNTRQLWWHGIPPSIRGLVWKLVIGNDLNITKELYEICLQRFQELLKTASSSPPSSSSSKSASPSLAKVAAKSPSSNSLLTKQVANGPALLSPTDGKDNPVSRESSVELIRLDVSRTFPSLCIFQKVGPYHEYLEGLLGAYVCYRPDVGYVQGMSFVAAILLLNMEADDAFICFANLLNRPVFIAFFRLDADMMKVYFSTYNFFFKNNLPKLYKHFLEQRLTADLYVIDWVFSIYSKCFNLDIVSRIWDVFFRDGEQFLFRTALGILKLFQPILVNMDFIQMAQFLVRPPESQVDQAELFHSIESIDMECRGMIFRQVLEQFKVNQLTN